MSTSATTTMAGDIHKKCSSSAQSNRRLVSLLIRLTVAPVECSWREARDSRSAFS